MESPWIGTAGQADFEEKVLTASKTVPVLVDFWAPWCGPCRVLGPLLERIVNSYEGKVRLVKVNTEENRSLAAVYRIQGIPAVKAFIDGRIADEFVGLLSERQIRDFLDLLVPTKSDELAQKGKTIEKERPLEAFHLYNEALKLDPKHPSSLIGKFRLLLSFNRVEEARSFYNHLPAAIQLHEETRRLQTLLDIALSRKNVPSIEELTAWLEKDPENLQHRFDLAVRLAGEGKYPEALEAYLIVVRKDRRSKGEAARKAMLQIFEVIGPRSPLAETYREKLAQLLF